MAQVLLDVAGVAKTFPNGTVALAGVDLRVAAGEVHGLLGANGAGKSTLIAILSGVLAASGGTIRWRGRPQRWTRPRDARRAGVATIYQHVPLVPTLSALENILLGEPGRWRRRPSERARVDAIVERLGRPFRLDAPAGELAIGQRQMVAVAQALASGADLVVMDEPTASLAATEREAVYRTIRQLARDEGKAVLFVSHFLDEILALTERVTVLRDGRAVLACDTAMLDEARLAAAIAGRAVMPLARGMRVAPRGTTGLRIEGVSVPGRLAPTDLSVAHGEIVGIAGMLGSGRSALLHAVFGAEPRATGRVSIDGTPVGRYPDEAVTAGLALVPEDRRRQGFTPQQSIAENIALPAIPQRWWLDRAADATAARGAIARLGITAPGPDALIGSLSGGNAQKAVLAKWLKPSTRALLLDEPAAGIDIGARTDILRLIRTLADDGLPVLLASSDFGDLLAISDRIIVLRDGAIVAAVDPAAVSETDLTLLAGGTIPATPGAAA